jgi:hypothetical protein
MLRLIMLHAAAAPAAAAGCRAYKEEEKKMGTLTNETIERPDSTNTAGECSAAAGCSLGRCI